MKGNVFAMAFLAVMAVGFFTGCKMGNGNVTSQERTNVISHEKTAEGFNEITLIGAGNVNVHPGENYRVIVTTDNNLQDRIITTVNGNTLWITQKSGSFNSTELTIDVYLPELRNISLDGAGNIKINAGEACELDLSLSGAGNIDAQNFQVQNITITHSGVGNSKIWATNTLHGNLSGVGNILYKGNPAINVKRTGVGTIKPL